MGVDVLILPIDDTEHILTYKKVDAIVQKYRPKAVIPAHYLTVGAESVPSGLKSANGWVRTQRDVRRVGSAELDLSPVDLKGAQGRVYYFGNDYETK
jgi:L-ascorbate metabolism protein UlaG (beta-lactamase superfamily)